MLYAHIFQEKHNISLPCFQKLILPSDPGPEAKKFDFFKVKPQN